MKAETVGGKADSFPEGSDEAPGGKGVSFLVEGDEASQF